MAFPAGLTTCVVTAGSTLNFGGMDGSITLTVTPVLGGNASHITWSASGQPLVAFSDSNSADAGTVAQVVVPHVDQAGFIDGSGNAATMWSYRATITAKVGRESKMWVKNFQPLAGQDTIDLDLLPDGSITSPTSAPIPAVTSVNGQTGAVTVESGGVDDATLAGMVTDTGTQTGAALSAAYARAKRIDLNKYMTIDGTTPNGAAIQNIIDNADEGSVLEWTGQTVIDATSGPLIWRSGLSLVGEGWGRSSMYVQGGASDYFPAIRRTAKDSGSVLNTLADCLFADFTIDGSGISGTDYVISAKAIFAQYMERCIFRSLHLKNTGATGLGVDFLRHCIIQNVITENCGRLWDGAGGGAAGIGIGTGGWEVEPLLIDNCLAIADGSVTRGQWGIFVEWQPTEPYRGRGYRITNCAVSGYHNGFGDRGTAGAQFVNCIADGNAAAGFQAVYGAQDGAWKDCTARNTTNGSGFLIQADVAGGYTIARNKSLDNEGRGFYINGYLPETMDMPHMTIEDNVAAGNAFDGIYIIGPPSSVAFDDLSVQRNTLYNNGQAGAWNADCGLNIQASVTNGRIKDNHGYDAQTTKTQYRGLRMPATASYAWADSVVAGNDMKNNVAENTFPGSQANTRVVFRHNIGGIETEATGATTIADGAASVVVNHGLAATPTSVVLGKRSSEDVWVSARTATTFTVTRTGTTGALTFDWSATLTLGIWP